MIRFHSCAVALFISSFVVFVTPIIVDLRTKIWGNIKSSGYLIIFLNLLLLLNISTGYPQNIKKSNKVNIDYLSRASNSCKAGDYNDAGKNIVKYLKQDNLDKEGLKNAHFLMGFCSAKKGHYPKAKYHFKIAIKKGYIYIPGTLNYEFLNSAAKEKAIYDKAYDQYKTKNYQGATKALEELLAHDLYKKDRLEPLFLFAQIQVQLKNDGGASKYFTKVLKIDKNYKPDKSKVREEELNLYHTTKQKYHRFWPTVKRILMFWK